MAALYGSLTAGGAATAPVAAASTAASTAITSTAAATVGGTTVAQAVGLVALTGLGVGLAITGIGIAGVAGEESYCLEDCGASITDPYSLLDASAYESI